jgi:hypothetical protein
MSELKDQNYEYYTLPGKNVRQNQTYPYLFFKALLLEKHLFDFLFITCSLLIKLKKKLLLLITKLKKIKNSESCLVFLANE